MPLADLELILIVAYGAALAGFVQGLSGFGDKNGGFGGPAGPSPTENGFGTRQVVDLKAFFQAGTGFAPVLA